MSPLHGLFKKTSQNRCFELLGFYNFSMQKEGQNITNRESMSKIVSNTVHVILYSVYETNTDLLVQLSFALKISRSLLMSLFLSCPLMYIL